MTRNTDPKPTTYAEWEDLEEERDSLRAERDSLASELQVVRAELAKSGLSCDRCQSAHCCSVVGTPPGCVADPDGSLPLWMPWTNEDVRKIDEVRWSEIDRLRGELVRTKRNHLRRMAQAALHREMWCKRRIVVHWDVMHRGGTRFAGLQTAIRAALAAMEGGVK